MNDVDDVVAALQMRANWVETGNVVLSRNDAIASGQHKLIRPLADDQLELVRRLRDLAAELLDGRASIRR